MSFFRKCLRFLLARGFLRFLSDKQYLKLKYWSFFNQQLNIDNPNTYNEKLQWLKLYDRKKIYTIMVDKYKVKKYVADIIGEQYIIPTLGVWVKFDDIDFDKLPNQFVLKCTHDSGGLCIVKDKNKIDEKKMKKMITKSLKHNYYYFSREWPYKNVEPRIIAEKYVENKKFKNLRDYKFFCFNGVPKIMYISDNSHTNYQRIAFFDMEYNQLNIKRKDYMDFDEIPEKPVNFEKMKALSMQLSQNIPQIRVDWYEIDGDIYFGELTFYTGSGFIPFEDETWNYKMGDMIVLPQECEKNEK